MKKQKTLAPLPDEDPSPTSPVKRKSKSSNAMPSPKSNFKYYQQFCNVFSLNCHLLQQVRHSFFVSQPSLTTLIDRTSRARKEAIRGPAGESGTM